MKSYCYKGFIIYHDGEWFRVNKAYYKKLKHAKNAINQYLSEKAREVQKQ